MDLAALGIGGWKPVGNIPRRSGGGGEMGESAGGCVRANKVASARTNLVSASLTNTEYSKNCTLSKSEWKTILGKYGGPRG
jgi:hypothetical protein